MDKKSEEVFVSDTVWYRVETAVQRELWIAAGHISSSVLTVYPGDSVETAVQRELCDQTPGSWLVTSLVQFGRDRCPERALRPDPWIAAGHISSRF